MFASVVVILFLIWIFTAIFGLNSLETASNKTKSLSWLREWFLQPENHSSILITSLAVLLLLCGIITLNSSKEILKALAPELIGIAITILVVDRLYQLRSSQLEKRQIIHQLASHSNEFALEAVRIARERGWLTDGTLRNASLSQANLKGADLSQADLRGANLFGANLEGAWLSNESQGYYLSANMLPFFLQNDEIQGADLRGANLSYATLNGAVLAKANLTDVSLEFSWLNKTNLVGTKLTNTNFWGAHLWDTDLRGTDLSMAKLEWTNIGKVIEDEDTKWPENSNNTTVHG